MIINTARLTMTAATVAIARAEIEDRPEFARMLGASVPDNWPTESAADVLPLFLGWLEAAPDAVGWFGWYALANVEGSDLPVLVAGGGFLGPPNDGTVVIGYSVLPQYQGRGYATEMVIGLVNWATLQAGMERITTETEWANPSSVRVLTKSGFACLGPGEAPDSQRFEFVADT